MHKIVMVHNVHVKCFQRRQGLSLNHLQDIGAIIIGLNHPSGADPKSSFTRYLKSQIHSLSKNMYKVELCK